MKLKANKTNELSGKIIRQSQNTVIVEIKRKTKHSKYGKTLNISFTYMVHNPNNKYKIGEFIKLKPCRPYSKRKKWIATNLLN